MKKVIPIIVLAGTIAMATLFVRAFACCLLLVLCLMTSGCFVWGTGGKAQVEPAVISDDDHALDSAGHTTKPTPGQLTGLKNVVVLPFFESSFWGYEVLPAHSVDAGGAINYPLRLFADSFTFFGGRFVIREGAVVFAQDCWPRGFVQGWFASEWLEHYPPDRPNATGADQLMIVRLYPRTRQPGDEVTELNDVLDDILTSQPGRLMDCIDHSHYIDDRQRLLVYRQLVDFMDAMEAARKDDKLRRQFTKARQGIKVRIDKLTGH